MRIRGMAETSQKAHIRALKDFTAFLGRSAGTATPDELRAYQLHMTDSEVTPSVYNARITVLRSFFGMSCDREDMKKYMQFRTEPRKLPIVLSIEEVAAVLAAAPGHTATQSRMRPFVVTAACFIVSMTEFPDKTPFAGNRSASAWWGQTIDP